MSVATESRVVELRFDNQQFEAGIKQSLESLQQLKTALDQNITGETFNNLDRAARSVDLSGIQSGIEALTDRFSTLGIVGMTVIQNLTNAILGGLSNAISSVTNSIISGGIRRATNIEKARFQLQGILNDEKKVTEVMNNASASVDGTAYSLDAAAKAASQLAASGVEAGEQMTSVLQGIAGVAATTSSDYEGISRIFTQIAGNGRLMGDQLLQLSSRGLNAAATLKDYFNGVQNGSIQASDKVKELISNITGGTTGGGGLTSSIEKAGNTAKKAASSGVDAVKKALEEEYEVRKKAYDKQYKLLQKSLNEQYNAKKKELDASYNALSKSLDEEIKEQQKANSLRLKEAKSNYDAQVQEYRKATNERIALINKEYTESIKLIDEDRYNRIKAVQDEIDAINERTEAEQKAKKYEANEAKRAEIQSIIDKAKSNKTRKQAQQVMSDFEKELEEERVAEERKLHIKELNESIKDINEEADAKISAERERTNEQISNIQDESSARLTEMSENYQAEIEAMQEANEAKLEEMREAKSERLTVLRESQQAELESIRESQNEELEAYREGQTNELNQLKEAINEQQKAISGATAKATGAAAKFHGLTEVTEGDIRDMVSSGLIGFDIFSEAMKETFGEHAYDANKTFEGAMSNIRAALARTGEMFVAPLIKEEGPLVDLLNAIRIKVNDFNTVLKPIAETVGRIVNEWLPTITKKINDFGFTITKVVQTGNEAPKKIKYFVSAGQILLDLLRGLVRTLIAIPSYISPITDAFKSVFHFNAEKVAAFAKNFEHMSNNFKLGEEAAIKLKNVFESVFNLIKTGIDTVVRLIKAFSPLKELFSIFSIDLGAMSDYIKTSIDNFIKWITTSEKVENVFKKITEYSKIFVDWVKYAVVQVQGAIAVVNESIDKFLVQFNKLKKLVTAAFKRSFAGFDVGKYFTEGFLNGLTSFIPNVIKRIKKFGEEVLQAFRFVLGIHSPSEETKELGELTGLGFAEGISGTISVVVDMVTNMLNSVLNNIVEFLKKIDWQGIILSIIDGITKLIERISQFITEKIPTMVSNVKGFIDQIIEGIQEDNPGETLAGSFVKAFIQGLKNLWNTLVTSVSTMFYTLLTSINEEFKDFSLKEIVQTGKDTVVNFAKSIMTTIKEWVGPVSESLSQIFGNITPEGLIAMAAGIAVIVTLTKLAAPLKNIINPLNSFNGVLISLKKTLKNYALDLKATALLKIAAAITMVIGAFVVAYTMLGDVDWPKFIALSVLFAAAIAAIGFVFVKIMELKEKADSSTTAFAQAAKALRSIALNKAVTGVIDTIVNMMESIVVSIAGLTILYTQYGEQLKKATGIFIAIGVVLAGLIALMVSISSEMGKSGNIEGLRSSAVSFLSLAAALYLILTSIIKILSMDINWKAERSKLLSIGIIFTIVVLVIKQLAKANNELEQNRGSLRLGLMIGFCVALMATIKALDMLIKKGISLKKNLPQLGMLATIFGVLLVVVNVLAKVMNSVEKGKTLKMGGTLLGVCAFLIVAVAAIGMLSMFPMSTYIKGLTLLVGVLYALEIACKAAGNVGSGANHKAIIAMGAVIAAMVVAIGALSMLEGDKLVTGLTAVVAAVLALAVAMYSLSKINIGKNNKTIGALITMIIAIVAVGAAIYILKDVPWHSALSIAGSIAGVLLAISYCMDIMQNAKSFSFKKDGAKYIIGIILLAAIGYGLKYLSEGIQWDSVLSLAGSIGIALLAMAECIKIVQSSDDFHVDDFLKYFMGIIAVGAIGWLLSTLSDGVQWDSVLALATSIGIALLAMAECIKLVQSAPDFEWADAKNYIVGILSILIVGGILKYLSEGVQWDSCLSLAGSIATVLIAMAVCMGIVGQLETTWKQAGMAAVLLAEALVAVGGIGYILHQASKGTDWKATLAMSVGISVVLIAMAIAMAICSFVGNFAGPAAIGLGLLDLFIADLGLVLYALGKLAEDPSIVRIISDGGKLLSLIGEALGNFVGSIVEGALTKISDSFPKIGKNLAEFSKESEPFFNMLKGIDNEMALSAESLASVIIALGKGEMYDAFGNLINMFVGEKDASSFGEKLANFAESIVTFAENTKDINSYHLKNVAEAAKTLVEIGDSVPSEGGLSELFTGKNDIEQFGKKLEPFSKSLNVVATNFSSVTNLSKFKEISDAMSYIINMATSIPNSGGWLGNVLGNNEVDDFGTKLESFSASMTVFSNNFKTVTNLSKFKEISDAMSYIINMAASLPNSGGWLDNLIGNNDIDDFGKKLSNFSSHLNTVSKNLNNGQPITYSLTKLSDSIPVVKEIGIQLSETLSSYRGRRNIDEFFEDINAYMGALINSTISVGIIDIQALYDIIKFTTPIEIIKNDLENLFTKYASRVSNNVNSFFEDLKNYILSITTVTMLMFDVAVLNDIIMSLGFIETIKKDLEFNFTKYASRVSNNINSFFEDLNNYIKALLTINMMLITMTDMTFLYNLMLSFETIKIIKDGMEVNFTKYASRVSNNLNKFFEDFMMYARGIEEISNLNYGSMYRIGELEETIGPVSSMAKYFGTTFAGYKSKKLSDILSDLALYASTICQVSNDVSTVDVVLFNTLFEVSNIVKEIKKVFENLNEYKTRNFSSFMGDLQNYTSTISSLPDMNKQINTLNELVDITNKFIAVIPKLKDFTADKFLDFLKQFKKYGDEGIKDFIKALDESDNTIKDSVRKMLSYVDNHIKDNKRTMENSGRDIVSYINDGINSNGESLKRAMRDLLNYVKDWMDYRPMETAGRYAVEGFCRGIRDNLHMAENAGWDLGNAAYWAAKRSLNEHSPSKKMEEVGSYAGEGFVDGFLKWLKASSKAGEEIGDSAQEGLKEALNNIGKEIQNETDFTTTITPILDLSNIQNGAYQINDMLNANRTIGLAANAGLSFTGGLSSLLSNIQASIPDNTNDDVVASINDLRSDLNILSSRVASLQVVMDTGELVGVLTNPIDEQIGYNAKLVGRGVI